MSETSQSVGRIAILTAFTLLFAAAWRSDRPAPSGSPAPIAWIKRGSDYSTDAELSGGFAIGIHAVGPLVENSLLETHVPGRLLSAVKRASDAPKPLFSGSPALLGRSSDVPSGEEPRTAAAETLVQTRE